MTRTVGELAQAVGGRVLGDPACRITAVASLDDATPGTISFLSNPTFRRHLATTQASAVILGEDDAPRCRVTALVSDNPYAAYARVAALLHPPPAVAPGIHATAWVDPAAEVDATAWVGPHSAVEAGAVVGPGASIGPGCLVGAGARIGGDSRLVARVTICAGVIVGRRALIHPGAVLGGDGFGIAMDDDTWVRVPQLGGVRLGDDVEVGANSTVDRGSLTDTVLEDDVKLDNQVQVGHNVHIGAHTAIAGCVGIAGSTRIGRYCLIGGGAGIGGHLTIGDRVQITGMSMISRSITTPGVYSSGIPADGNVQHNRNAARFRHLDDLARRLNRLEKKVK